MSNGMEFTIPPTPSNTLTDADLMRLTDDAVAYWIQRGAWTIDEACALLRGFVPIESWEPDHTIRSLLLQVYTAPLKAELRDQSVEPLPDSLPPTQWLKKAMKCGKVCDQIKRAIKGGKSTETKREDREAAILRAADMACQELAENRTERTWHKIAVRVCQILRDEGIKHSRGNWYEPNGIVRILNKYKYVRK